MFIVANQRYACQERQQVHTIVAEDCAASIVLFTTIDRGFRDDALKDRVVPWRPDGKVFPPLSSQFWECKS
jgi:hypothetical protein